MEATPSTLIQAVQYFMNPDNCISYLAAHRWPDGEPICPRCGSKDVGFIASRRVWQCKTRHPLAQFSIKVGTIFEDSPLGLDKWLPAMWMIGSNRNGISSWELHRAIGVTQKTAWFMLHRIRLCGPPLVLRFAPHDFRVRNFENAIHQPRECVVF